MRSRWRKFRALSMTERNLLVEATFALGGARLALICVPFRRIAAWLGCLGIESSTSVSSFHDAMAKQVGWAIETMSRHLPWQCRCLAQALAAWWMLNRRGITGTIYFGVANAPAKPFSAHAWMRCGSRVVTGGNNRERFRVLACFARNEI